MKGMASTKSKLIIGFFTMKMEKKKRSFCRKQNRVVVVLISKGEIVKKRNIKIM
jgi:hypothetical protein